MTWLSEVDTAVFQAKATDGYVYPTVAVHDQNLRHIGRHDQVCRAAAWRVAAIQSAGGIESMRELDGQTMAMRLRSVGWRGRKAEMTVAYVQASMPAVVKPAPRISVCIGCLDEPEELEATVQSLRDTAGDIEINVVDDGSAKPIKPVDQAVRLHRNVSRQGSGSAKHQAVCMASYEHVLILDCHMRFEKDWLDKAGQYLGDPNTIWCPACAGLEHGFMDVSRPRGLYFGAALHFITPERNEFFQGRWQNEKSEDGYELSCLMGGAYFFPKHLFSKLGGFSGLKQWGAEEESISLRAWLSGARVRMAKQVKIGHKFRSKDGPVPYVTQPVWVTYNKLRSMRTIMETRDFVEVERKLPPSTDLRLANTWLQAEWRQLEIESRRLGGLFVHDLRWFCDRLGVVHPMEIN